MLPAAREWATWQICTKQVVFHVLHRLGGLLRRRLLNWGLTLNRTLQKARQHPEHATTALSSFFQQAAHILKVVTLSQRCRKCSAEHDWQAMILMGAAVPFWRLLRDLGVQNYAALW
jgi:hypothetical protein